MQSSDNPQQEARRQFDVVKEPRDETYRALLAYLFEASDSFQLMSYAGGQESPLLALLDAGVLLVSEQDVSTWPGTSSGSSHLPTLYRFTSDKALSPILEAPGRLYAWVQPFPEDIAFFRDTDGEDLLFGSIAHEKDAWLMLTENEAHELVLSAPGLVIAPRKELPEEWDYKVCVFATVPNPEVGELVADELRKSPNVIVVSVSDPDPYEDDKVDVEVSIVGTEAQVLELERTITDAVEKVGGSYDFDSIFGTRDS